MAQKCQRTITSTTKRSIVLRMRILAPFKVFSWRGGKGAWDGFFSFLAIPFFLGLFLSSSSFPFPVSLTSETDCDLEAVSETQHPKMETILGPVEAREF